MYFEKRRLEEKIKERKELLKRRIKKLRLKKKKDQKDLKNHN